MAYIAFSDEILGSECQFQFRVTINDKQISARDIITSRVAEEAKRIMSGKTKKALVQPTNLEELLNGKTAKKIDLKKQKKLAIEAFQTNSFLLFINDRQITDLDEQFPLVKDLKVKFLKLIPLAGG